MSQRQSQTRAQIRMMERMQNDLAKPEPATQATEKQTSGGGPVTSRPGLPGLIFAPSSAASSAPDDLATGMTRRTAI